MKEGERRRVRARRGGRRKRKGESESEKEEGERQEREKSCYLPHLTGGDKAAICFHVSSLGID